MLEWRSRSELAETSSSFLDDADDGPRPHELYGKFTWKIENFSEISKRELRSNVFDVGNYKWYILVYPQGCDVCNHLSLFLCVADYDKLLPGWSHFAQFTIAVVNKDPKKSKYSDTLHRFCKKEHDWGWKKFMELSKVLDGFTVADTLVIKAQVQVILDKPSKPFRCLDPQYRRELVRVYLTNVEGICRRFCEDKKSRIAWAGDEAFSFRHFWASLAPEQQRKLLTDKGEVILKAVVKQFFNEKEVTSTLVMDALYSGCKQIDEHSRAWLEGKCSDNMPVVLIKAERSTFTLCGDLLDIVDRVQKDFIPAAKDDNRALQPNDGLTLRSGQEGDDYRRDSIERDEKRLAELGRKTIEMFVISHIFCEKLEIAYREAEALKRQDQLIAEEFEMARLEESKAQAKAQADKEKKAKKKEKVKQRKEAEKLRREAEEAERKAREEEARRQEAERKTKEAERRRLEEAAAQGQPHGAQQSRSRAVKAKEDKKQAQLSAQQAPRAKQTGSDAVVRQQQAGPSGLSSSPAASSSLVGATGPPSLSSLATAAMPDAAAPTALAMAGQAYRSEEQVGTSDSSGEEEVGTVDQATGTVESSGDWEEDLDVGTAGRLAGGPGGGPTESDGESESDDRAALEEEVVILRAQVVQLQKLLAERDAELFALRAQLSELQPHEIADAVREAGRARGSADGVEAASATATAGSQSSSSAGGREAAVPVDTSGAATARAEAAQAASAAATAPSGKADSGLANGSKEGISSSTIPAAAAAAAAAAVRRMQPPAVGGASSQEPQSNGSVRGAGAGPMTAAARGTGQGRAAAGAAHLGSDSASFGHAAQAALGQQAAAASASGAGAGEAQGPAMQRSASATLPGAASSSGGAAQYQPLAAHQLANGRARAQGHDGGAGISGAAPGKPAPYMPTVVAASSAALSNGMAGTLHSGGQEGLSTFRNATAGVLPAGQTSGAASGVRAQAASGMPVSSSAAPAAQKRAEDSAGASGARHIGHGVVPAASSSTEGPFSSNARMMMAQAQRSSLAFGTPTAVQNASAKRMAAAAQMDSPGLEDFAHINMIDDLLTE